MHGNLLILFRCMRIVVVDIVTGSWNSFGSSQQCPDDGWSGTVTHRYSSVRVPLSLTHRRDASDGYMKLGHGER